MGGGWSIPGLFQREQSVQGGDAIPPFPGALWESRWKQLEQGSPAREYRDWEVPGWCGKRAGLSVLGGMGDESQNILP